MKLYLSKTNIMLNVPCFINKIKNKDGTVSILYNNIYAAAVDIAKKANNTGLNNVTQTELYKK